MAIIILIQTFHNRFSDIQNLVGRKFLPDSVVSLLDGRISDDIKRLVVEYPFVAALTNGNGEGHAIAIIGHSPVQSAVDLLAGKLGIVDTFELVNYLVASDDNHLPYSRVEKNNKNIVQTNGNIYCYKNIGAAVVPFYEKMFLDVCAIFRGNNYLGCLEMIEKSYLNFPSGTAVVRRVLLTSSKSYKRFISQNCNDNLTFRTF